MSVHLNRIRYQEEIVVGFFDNPIELNFDNTQLFQYHPGIKVRLKLESQRASSPSYWDGYFKSYPDLNEGHPEMFRNNIVIVLLASLGYILPYHIDFPCAKSIQIIALSVLTAAGFGIMRDLRICYQCIEYYTIGHSSLHKRRLKTNHPIANGLVLGLFSGRLGIPLGVGLALAARATKYNPITADRMTRYVAALAIISSIITYMAARRAEKFLNDAPAPQERIDIFKGIIYPTQPYHPVDLRKIPKDKQIAWLACGVSNLMGDYFFCGGSLLLMVGVVAVRFFKR